MLMFNFVQKENKSKLLTQIIKYSTIRDDFTTFVYRLIHNAV